MHTKNCSKQCFSSWSMTKLAEIHYNWRAKLNCI